MLEAAVTTVFIVSEIACIESALSAVGAAFISDMKTLLVTYVVLAVYYWCTALQS